MYFVCIVEQLNENIDANGENNGGMNGANGQNNGVINNDNCFDTPLNQSENSMTIDTNSENDDGLVHVPQLGENNDDMNDAANGQNNGVMNNDNSLDTPLNQTEISMTIDTNLENNDGLVDVPKLGEGNASENHDNNHGNVDETESKYGLAEVDIDDDDLTAISHLIDENSHADQTNGNRNGNADGDVSDVLATIPLEQNEKAEVRDGKIIITKVIDDETEMTYAYGEKIKVLPPLYQLKMNDAISGNIPFKANV